MTLTELQTDLRQGMTIHEALTKHNITFEQAFTELKKAQNPKIYKKSPKRDPSMKYITKNKTDGKYYIRKGIGHKGKKKTLRYGTYRTLEDAKTIRDALIENGWQQRSVDRLCKEHHIYRCDKQSKVRYS